MPIGASIAGILTDLFESLPSVMFCVKDGDGRYVAANDAFVRRTRARHRHLVIGFRAVDLFPPELAFEYEAQDLSVLRTGVSVRNQLEVIPDPDGIERWYLTTKTLVHHDDEPMIVVVSVEANLGSDEVARGLRAAIDLVHTRPGQVVRVGDMARAAGMTSNRLERAMRRALGVSPKQYSMRFRVELAARLLATTSEPIGRIATDCGYYDQSQFTRQFRAHTGLTPRQYRAAAVWPPSFSGRR